MYGIAYMFRYYIAIFWEMLKWGAVDLRSPIHNILSTAPQLSISQ
jgi:hypothetical protein